MLETVVVAQKAPEIFQVKQWHSRIDFKNL
jgi:hypothetical protein